MDSLIKSKSIYNAKLNSSLNNTISNSFIRNDYIFKKSCSKMNNVSQNISVETVVKFKDFKNFYQMPFELYKNDPLWVPPFWYEFKNFFKTKNPFWTHSECNLFLVKKNDRIVGRIAAIIDYKFCETVGNNIGYFGFFECENDYDCAEALLKTAEEWLVLKKMKKMRGPIDGRVDFGCGFLQTGYNSSPCLLSSYSPAYYISFVENFGMKKSRDQFLYYIDLTKPLPEKLQDKAQKCSDSGVTIRRFNRLRTQKELKWWVRFFLQTFAEHWGYVPVSDEEVKSRFGISNLRWFVDSHLFLVAELNGSPIAYIWSTPDYNQIFKKMKGRLDPYQLLQFFFKKKDITMGKLPLIGIKKEFRNKSIGSYLNYHTLVEMKNRGYIGAEVGWIDEKNTVAHTTIAITGAKLYKKLRVFEKNIENR